MLLDRVERMERITVPYAIPFYSQYFDSTHCEQYGFSHPEVAQYWSDHGDGVACVRMVVDGLCARNDMPKTQSEWIHIAIKNHIFSSETGWNHRGLVDMARRAGVRGIAKYGQPLNAFIYELEQGHPCITPVTTLFKDRRVDGKGNLQEVGDHLVVVFGLELNDQVISHLLVHHPSSVVKDNLRNKWVWVNDFENSYTGNYMTFWK